MTAPIITADTVHDWERVMDDVARQHPEATFRGLIVRRDPKPLGEWVGHAAYEWPDESPWLGINPDGTRKAKP